MKKIYILLTAIFLINFNSVKADSPHFIDFKYILNESDAGKKAQNFLKKKLSDGLANLKKKEAEILKEEKKIIEQKKVISAEEYKKKVVELRKSVSSIQKERNSLLESVAKQRSIARQELLKNLNPIVKEYMQKNNVRMVIDKKSLLMADEKLDATKDIMSLLNSKLKSIKLK